MPWSPVYTITLANLGLVAKVVGTFGGWRWRLVFVWCLPFPACGDLCSHHDRCLLFDDRLTYNYVRTACKTKDIDTALH